MSLDHFRGSGIRLAVIVVAVTPTPVVSAAQYFGHNKVRYDQFAFKVLKTDHFDIYYYDREERAIHDTARLAERWSARLAELVDHKLTRRQPLILYASHADFEQTTVSRGFISEATGGACRRSVGRRGGAHPLPPSE